MVVSADDPSTPEIDGFKKDNKLSLKVWNSWYEEDLNDIEFLYGSGNQFEAGSTSVIKVNSTSSAVSDITVSETSLGNTYPNPFRQSTMIPFALGEKTKVDIAVYNILGQRVKTLIQATLSSGTYNVEWNGTDKNGKYMMSGIYYIKMVAGGQVYVKTVELIRN